MAFGYSLMLAVIERPDGSTYYQHYTGGFDGLLELKAAIGKKYWIVDIIDDELIDERKA